MPECLSCAIAADAGLRHEVITQAHQVAVTEGVSDDGYRVVFHAGPRAGQTVPHVTLTCPAAAPSPGRPG